MTKTSRLLAASTLVVAINALSSVDKLCSWSNARAASIRDAFYIDGGDLEHTQWTDSGPLPQTQSQPVNGPNGSLYRFDYGRTYDFSSTSIFDMDSYTEQFLDYISLTPGGSQSAPNYWDGAMLASDFEFYTYGSE